MFGIIQLKTYFLLNPFYLSVYDRTHTQPDGGTSSPRKSSNPQKQHRRPLQNLLEHNLSSFLLTVYPLKLLIPFSYVLVLSPNALLLLSTCTSNKLIKVFVIAHKCKLYEQIFMGSRLNFECNKFYRFSLV